MGDPAIPIHVALEKLETFVVATSPELPGLFVVAESQDLTRELAISLRTYGELISIAGMQNNAELESEVNGESFQHELRHLADRLDTGLEFDKVLDVHWVGDSRVTT